jgi:GNAT superfamily N-acetyltransferase
MASEADLDQICVIADEVAALHHGHVPEIFAAPDTLRDREFWKSWITQTQSTIHVATHQETVVGFITAKVAPGTVATILKSRIVCRIGTIAVSSGARRHGVGTALMRSIEAWAIGQSAVEVVGLTRVTWTAA